MAGTFDATRARLDAARGRLREMQSGEVDRLAAKGRFRLNDVLDPLDILGAAKGFFGVEDRETPTNSPPSKEAADPYNQMDPGAASAGPPEAGGGSTVVPKASDSMPGYKPGAPGAAPSSKPGAPAAPPSGEDGAEDAPRSSLWDAFEAGRSGKQVGVGSLPNARRDAARSALSGRREL